MLESYHSTAYVSRFFKIQPFDDKAASEPIEGIFRFLKIGAVSEST
jgi:hypothetical protein